MKTVSFYLAACCALLLTLFSNTAISATADFDRGLAELMGDMMYYQFDPSPITRSKVTKAASALREQSNAAGDMSAAKISSDVLALITTNQKKITFDFQKLKNITDAYDARLQKTLIKANKDAIFLLFDLRYRYLSKTTASNDGSITVVPTTRSLEDAFADADKIMQKISAQNKSLIAVKKWGFLRTKIGDAGTQGLPTLANNMLVKMVSDLGKFY